MFLSEKHFVKREIVGRGTHELLYLYEWPNNCYVSYSRTPHIFIYIKKYHNSIN
jgi:hypothetical protein